MATTTPTVAPRGPILVCYRQDDGAATAQDIANMLRAVGVPVWIDSSDMGVGTFDSTFHRAARRGLSGTVFVATPNVVRSDFIREQEAPTWDALARDPDFILAVVNDHPSTESDGVDYSFPDSLLRDVQSSLADFKQYPVSDPQYLDDLCRDITYRRLEILRAEQDVPDDELRLEIVTRAAPATAPTRWEIRSEIGPPLDGETLLTAPHRAQTAALTRNLPRLADRLGVQTVRIRGGLHLPVAAAVGMALPITRPGAVIFHDNTNAEWSSSGSATEIPELRTQGSSIGAAAGVAVLVDMVDAGEPEPAFDAMAQSLNIPSRTIALAVRSAIHPDAAVGLSRRIAAEIRDFAATNPGPVRLAMRAPAGLALHLGRHLNTLDVDLYDLDRHRTEYVRFARARAGGPNIIMETA